jgi:hypothetical protein
VSARLGGDIAVKKYAHIGSLVADMHRELPCIIANVSTPSGPFYRGQRLYLATPQEIDEPLCEVRYRDRATGKLFSEGFRWQDMKEVRIAVVSGHIAARCWRGTPDEMEAVLKQIVERYCPRIDDFSPDIDV